MNPLKQLLRRRLAGLFLVLACPTLSTFAQSTTPSISVHQGLPGNNDQYAQIAFGGGTYLACLKEPVEFFTSKNGRDWSRFPGPDLGNGFSSFANAIQSPSLVYGEGKWVVVADSGKVLGHGWKRTHHIPFQFAGRRVSSGDPNARWPAVFPAGPSCELI